MKSLRLVQLIALCERVIVDMRDVIVALERGDIDGALAKWRESAERISGHASALANAPESKEGRQ